MAESAILSRYLERTPESARLSAEAVRTLPGGDTRSSVWFEPYPPFVREGSGAFLTDVDGNRYLDLLNNYTSLIHGHAHPAVVAAVGRQLDRGASFAALHPETLRLAQAICERVPSIDQLRFTNSGTEAVMMAVRVARAYTGRPLVAKVEGGYHGTWDDVQLSVAPPAELMGDPDRPVAVPASPGLAPGVEARTVVVPYNDLAAARAILEPLADRLAAVIVEPMNGSAGMLPAEPGYVAGLRRLTRELGALLVLDEVITFRLAPGGAQSLDDLWPDLTTLGKIIGGGLPIGAFGGRAEVMAVCDPRRPGAVQHAGTFNGNPLSTAAGAATLELLPQSEYDRINALGERLREGIEEAGRELGVAVCATGRGSLLNTHLSEAPPRRYRDVALHTDRAAAGLFHLALLNEGVFVAPRGLMAVSTPMDDALVDEALQAIRRALGAVAAEQHVAEPVPSRAG